MRILIVGAGGLVGTALRARASARGFEVAALTRFDCDVTDDRARDAALLAHRPTAVIFAAARTSVDRCRDDPTSEAVNVAAPVAWARRVETWFLSSNFVFDGPGPHPPNTPPRPTGVYAGQKARAEEGVLAAGGHVVRVGWVLGPTGRTFGSTIAGRLRRGETVDALYDLRVQPTWSEDVADAVLELPRGISHAIGREETSWYGFSLAVWARIGTGAVRPVRLAELGLTEPRPRDTRLAPATLPGWTERLEDLLRRT